jgi:hypothetical protein
MNWRRVVMGAPVRRLVGTSSILPPPQRARYCTWGQLSGCKPKGVQDRGAEPLLLFAGLLAAPPDAVLSLGAGAA